MKRNGFLAIFLFFAILGIFNSCSDNDTQGNGNVIIQERAVSGFSGVSLDGVGNVNIQYSQNFKVIVTTDSNIQDLITISDNADVLYISERDNKGFNATKLVIDVYMPEIGNVTLKGAGNINILDGKTSDFEIVLSGTGNIDAQNYKTKNAVVNLSGAGDIKLWATNSLTGKLSGVGNIYYKGNPSVKGVNITGIGNVSGL